MREMLRYAKYRKKHSKEWVGRKSANNITGLPIVANIINLSITEYMLLNVGVTMN